MTHAVVFSESYVWTFFNQLALLFAAMLLGNIIRTQVPFIKKLYIPSALIGGALVLILKTVPAINSFIDRSVMQIITYHCLGIGFAALALKTAKSKRRVSSVKIVESGAIMASSYLLQAVIGLVISVAGFFIADCFYAAGLILPMGFGQSTGSALSWGSKYETAYGFGGGASYGLAVAAIGFIVGSVIGVIYLNALIRKGKYSPLRNISRACAEDGEEAENEIPDSESIDKLSVQLCFVILGYTLAQLFMRLLSATGVSAVEDLAWGLNFLWALLFGFLMKVVLNLLRKNGVVRRAYINNNLMDRISGFMFDLMIVAGVVAIDFEDIYMNLPLLVITCVCGTVVTFFYVKAATRHTYKGYELESFLTNFGTVTGTVSTGMILLREIDPNYVTPAASNIVLQNIPSLVMLAPLLLTMGFAASSLQHTLIMLGVYAFLLVAYNIFLFRRSIFKKRYAGAADELSAGVHDR